MKTDFATYIELRNNEVDKNTPPTSHETDHVEIECADYNNPNPFINKLARQLLNMADADDCNLTFMDKETLEDVMKYGSVSKVARLRHVSNESIRKRVNKCLDVITRQIAIWQDPQEKIQLLLQKITELEDAAAPKNNLLKIQAEKVRELEKENERLRDMINNPKPVEAPSRHDFVIVDSQMKKRLTHTLDKFRFSPLIVQRLKARNIYKLIDLIRLSERELSQLDGINANHVNSIIHQLDSLGFHLGTELKWDETIMEYYIKKK